MTPGSDVAECQFTFEELRLVVDESHSRNLPITVHAHTVAAVEQAIAAGADGIEHCTCVGPRRPRLLGRPDGPPPRGEHRRMPHIGEGARRRVATPDPRDARPVRDDPRGPAAMRSRQRMPPVSASSPATTRGSTRASATVCSLKPSSSCTREVSRSEMRWSRRPRPPLTAVASAIARAGSAPATTRTSRSSRATCSQISPALRAVEWVFVGGVAVS